MGHSTIRLSQLNFYTYTVRNFVGQCLYFQVLHHSSKGSMTQTWIRQLENGSEYHNENNESLT